MSKMVNFRTYEEFKNYIKGKLAVVAGVGISNAPLVRLLLSLGASVEARDKKPVSEIPGGEELISLGARFITGEDYLRDIEADIIFRTPGIRPDRAEFKKAVEKGAILTSEMELFLNICPAKIFAVTGSDGKTTTTTLISMLLRKTGKTVYLGGNIGESLLPLVSKMTKEDFAVVELSSFQLMEAVIAPDVAVITNLSENHLDWHKDMEEYLKAKENIFINQKKESLLVLNYDNRFTRGEANKAPGSVRFFSKSEETDAFYKNGEVRLSKNPEPLLRDKDILLPGVHNRENYMAAYLAVMDYVNREQLLEVASGFGGVPHRLELIRELEGVKYYNSSIDSSPARTAAALCSFNQKVIVIAGGYDKHLDYSPLREVFGRKVKSAILTGATADKIEAAVKDVTPVTRKENLVEAIKYAKEIAESGDIVVLSPASASFDAFKNFEERGNLFRDTVKAL